MAVIDPVAYGAMEAVRNELIDIIEESLDETEFPAWSKRDDQFEFMRHQIVVFDTELKADTPASFLDIIPGISLGSVFYHFVDARRRNDNALDDFQNWLIGFDDTYTDLGRMINDICPYFTPLKKLREELDRAFVSYFNKEES